MVRTLKPLRKSTECLSQEKKPTVGLMIPVLYQLAHVTVAPIEDKATAQMSNGEIFQHALGTSLRRRWCTMTDPMPDILLLGLYLDVRFKDFIFVQDEEQKQTWLNAAKAAALTCLETRAALPPSQLSQADPMNAQIENSQQREHREDMTSILGSRIMSAVRHSRSSEESIIAELEQYHQLSAVPSMLRGGALFDPLTWWREKAAEYPRLAKLARSHLAVSATSVPSERAFSKGGWLIDKRRCSLSHSSVSLLMFLCCNGTP